MIQLTQKIGDTRTFSIPLSWGGRPFVPGSDWNLLFTVKSSVDVPDSARLLQKQTSGLGITVVGRTASVEILRADTFREADYPEVGDPSFEAAAGDYVWDIKATKIDDGETRTVASGTHTLIRPVGWMSSGTGPIYTTEDPLIASGMAVVSSATPPTDTTVIWHDTNDNTLNFWDGNVWVCIGEAGPMLDVETIPALAYLNASGGGYITSTGGFYLAADDGGIPDLAYLNATGGGYITSTGGFYLDAA